MPPPAPPDAALSNLQAGGLSAAQAVTLSAALTNLNSTNGTEGAATALLNFTSTANFSAPGVSSGVLSVLGQIAGGTLAAGGNASGSVVSSLNVVATADPTLVDQIAAVLTTLFSNQAAVLAATYSASSPPPPPFVASSPLINSSIQIQVAAAGAPIAITAAAGSLSVFQPLPAGLLPAGAAVVSTLVSLAFDPHGGVNNTGITQLSFSSLNGSVVEVQNASSPILFTLPPVSLDAGTQATCSFWDPATSNYSTHGCIAVPSPQPPGHTLSFIANFSTPTDASLTSAWQISGPMWEPDICETTILDCNVDAPCSGPVWGKACLVYPNPRDPLGVKVVSCPATNGTNATAPPARQPVLRVYSGVGCALWQNNTFNCAWSNVLQSFEGAGCVQGGGGVTQCMCRHLTDFASVRAPQVQTCSLSDMSSLTAADIVTKLKLLFAVVISLFGIMHLGAAIGIWVDASAHRRTMALLRVPASGFKEAQNGTWTWLLDHAAPTRSVEAPHGTAAELTTVLAFPFVRLRAAIPSEMMPGEVAHAMGMREGLSHEGLRENATDIGDVMTTLSANLSSFCCGGAKAERKRIPAQLIPEMMDVEVPTSPMSPPQEQELAVAPAQQRRGTFFFSDSKDVEAESPQPDPLATPARMVGTAIVLAHIAVSHALSLVEVSERRAAASLLFKGVRVPGIAHDFDTLCGMFCVMLGNEEGSLIVRRAWLNTARIWRLIFLQAEDGSWTPSHSLAFALASHEGPLPPPRVSAAKYPRLARLMQRLEKLEDLEDVLEDDTPDSQQQERGAALFSVSSAPEALARTDDPLTFHHRAFARRMPPQLAQIADGDRVWATLLGMTYAERSSCSMLVDEEEEDTIVDAARKYLEKRCRSDPALKQLFDDKVPQKAAHKAFRYWEAAYGYAIARARNAESLSNHRWLHYVQRAVSRVLKSVSTDHETFATFLDSDGDTTRWQRFFILCTLVLCALFTAILFYSSRGQSCCIELRTLLDTGAGQSCSAAPLSPRHSSFLLNSSALDDYGCDPATPAGLCLGYLGSCGDLASQFSEVQGAFMYNADGPGALTCYSTLADYVCHAFPDDAYASDQFFVSIICVAIALPVSLVLESLFEMSNEVAGAREGWLTFSLGRVMKLLLGAHAHADWHWTDRTRKPPTELAKWLTTNTNPTIPDAIQFVLFIWAPYIGRKVVRFVLGRKEEEEVERSDAASDASAPSENGDAADEPGHQHELVADDGPSSPRPAQPAPPPAPRAAPPGAEYFDYDDEPCWAAPPPVVVVGGDWATALAASMAMHAGGSQNGYASEEAEAAAAVAASMWLDDGSAPAEAAAPPPSAAAVPSHRRIAEPVVEREEKEEEGEGSQTSAERLAEERGEMWSRRANAAAGLIGIYVAWVIFAYFTFVYGMVIYKNLSAAAEATFASTWGISQGLDQVQQWKGVLQEAVKCSLLLVIMDILRVQSGKVWFESFIDFASVQAALFDGTAGGAWGQIKVLVRHQARVSD